MDVTFGVIGTVGIALHSARRVYELVGDIRGAPESVNSIAQDVKVLSNALEILQGTLRTFHSPEQVKVVPLLQMPVDNCVAVLHDIEIEIKPHIKAQAGRLNVWKGFVWAFREKDILSMQAKLSSYKQSLDIAIGVADLYSNVQSQMEVKQNFQAVRVGIRKLDRKLDADRESVANESYAGSEAGDSDYGYVMKRWLRRASTVFEEAATQEQLETESLDFESNQASTAEDRDTYGPRILDIAMERYGQHSGKSTDNDVPLHSSEELRHDTDTTANHNTINGRGSDDERRESLAQTIERLEAANLKSPVDTQAMQLKQVEHDWEDFFLKAGLWPHRCNKCSKAMARAGLNKSSQKDLTPLQLQELGLTNNETCQVMDLLERKFGQNSVKETKKRNEESLQTSTVQKPDPTETAKPQDAAQLKRSDVDNLMQFNVIYTDRPALFSVISIRRHFSRQPWHIAGWPFLNFRTDEAFDIISIGPLKRNGDCRWLARKQDLPQIIGWVMSQHMKQIPSKTAGMLTEADMAVTKVPNVVSQLSSTPTPDDETSATSSTPSALSAGQLTYHQVSHIRTSVRDTITTSRQLEDDLRLWSLDQVTDELVSDAYIRLTNKFNVACQSLHSAGVDTTDLFAASNMLVEIGTLLEDALSEFTSSPALVVYIAKLSNLLRDLEARLSQKLEETRPLFREQS